MEAGASVAGFSVGETVPLIDLLYGTALPSGADATAAIAALEPFALMNGFAVFMTGVIEKFFRQLVELKDAAERGKTSLATEGMVPFTVKKNMGFLRNWSLLELRVARKRFLDLREKVVSSSGSADVLVAAAIVRTCMRPTRGGAR